MHTRACAHTHTHTHTHTHWHSCTHPHTHTHIGTHAQIHTWTHRHGRFYGIHKLDYSPSNKIHISLTKCLMYLLKVSTHTSLRKAFEKIAKLKFGKYWVGCLCNIWLQLSPANNLWSPKLQRNVLWPIYKWGIATKQKWNYRITFFAKKGVRIHFITIVNIKMMSSCLNRLIYAIQMKNMSRNLIIACLVKEQLHDYWKCSICYTRITGLLISTNVAKNNCQLWFSMVQYDRHFVNWVS